MLLRPLALALAFLAIGASGGTASAQCETDKLLASDGAAFDFFGHEVAVSGDFAIVASQKNDAMGTDSGAVYVFERHERGWFQTQKLTASDASEGDHFGISVSLSSNIALIGAFGADNFSGAAYVFELMGSVWVQTAKLVPADVGCRRRSR